MNPRAPLTGAALLLAALGACSDVPPATSADMATAPDLAPGDPAAAKPQIIPLSATGHDRLFGAAYDGQGRLYGVGSLAESTDAAADARMVIARFTSAGALDPSFGQGGFTTLNAAVGTSGELLRGVVIQASGKIVAAGTVEHAGAADPRDRDVALVRFNSDGTLDKTFGKDGLALLDLSDGEVVGSTYVADTAWGLARDASDRLLIHAAQKRSGATDSDFVVVRLSRDGVVDATFGAAGRAALDISNRSASPRNLVVLPDGAIIAAGYMNDGVAVKPVVYKLTSGGQLDTGFATGGVYNQGVLAAATEAYSVALQGTALVTTGYGRDAATESLDFVSLRLTAAGALDPSYGTGGFARLDVGGFNDNSRQLLVLPDRRVMLLGGGRLKETDSDAAIAVLTESGGRDTSFGPKGLRLYDLGGTADFFWDAALSPEKDRVAVVGVKSSGTASGNDDAALLILPLWR